MDIIQYLGTTRIYGESVSNVSIFIGIVMLILVCSSLCNECEDNRNNIPMHRRGEGRMNPGKIAGEVVKSALINGGNLSEKILTEVGRSVRGDKTVHHHHYHHH